MILHTNKKERFILLKFLLILFLSCNKEGKTKIEIKSADTEQQHNLDSIDKSLDFSGIWVVSNRKKLGNWEQNEGYFYSQEQFMNHFDSLSIDINEQNVMITTSDLCYGTNTIVKDTLFSISGMDQRILNDFFEKELKVDASSYIGYISTECEYPLNKLYLFKDKIIIQEYGAYFFVLNKQENYLEQGFKIPKFTKQKILIKNPCKKIQGEMFSGEECILSSTTIEDSYRDILESKLIENTHFLLSELPNSNQTLKIEDAKSGLLSLVYQTKNQAIQIDMEYAGGVTTIILEQKGKDVSRRIIYYAD